jgi:hypothetical protein
VPTVSTDVPKSILDSADITAVIQLILRERESRDLGRWPSPASPPSLTFQ